MILLSVIYLLAVYLSEFIFYAEKPPEIMIWDCNELERLQIPAGAEQQKNTLECLSTNQNQAFNRLTDHYYTNLSILLSSATSKAYEFVKSFFKVIIRHGVYYWIDQ